MARGHEFHFLLFELDQRFRNPRVAGTDSAAGRGCTLVAVEDQAGRGASICFDDGNQLPLVLTYEPPGGAPGGTIRMVLEQWTKLDGVQYLAAFTLFQGDDVFTYRYHTIEPDSVPKSRFDRSAPE